MSHPRPGQNINKLSRTVTAFRGSGDRCVAASGDLKTVRNRTASGNATSAEYRFMAPSEDDLVICPEMLISAFMVTSGVYAEISKPG
ncbi:hypothetical protein [Kribbella deserti]|uniref:Uncharacterized protein n=1 Tax=Kribbella deserti TaxID=1926257 RepID=A0ABV6QXM3_9ACTN